MYMGALMSLTVLLFLPWSLCMFQGLTCLWVLNILIKIWGQGDDQNGGLLVVFFLFSRCVDIMGAVLSRGGVRPRL